MRAFWAIFMGCLLGFGFFQTAPSFAVVPDLGTKLDSSDVKKFAVTFDKIYVHESHDLVGSGHWDMLAAVNGQPMELLRSEGADQDEIIEFNNPNDVDRFLGQRTMEIAVPVDGKLIIEVNGRERDHTSDDAESSYKKVVDTWVSKGGEYLNSRYGRQLSETEKDIAYWKDIANGFKENDATWSKVLGETGGTAAGIAAIFGASTIPVWGQVGLTVFAVYNLIDVLADLNPDDGIGIIKFECRASDNSCLGTKTLPSQFNGIDDDSKGDYDMTFTVRALPITSSDSVDLELRSSFDAVDAQKKFPTSALSATSKITSVTIFPYQSVNVKVDSPGVIQLELPKSMISGVTNVMSGNQKIEYQKVRETDSTTTIRFALPSDQTSAQIQATHVIPEFDGLILAPVLTILIAGIILFGRYRSGLRLP